MKKNMVINKRILYVFKKKKKTSKAEIINDNDNKKFNINT